MTTLPDRPCTLDHPIPGRHQPDCDTPDCPGCHPALANPPTHICRWHTARAVRALGDIPDLIDHLHDMIEPGSSNGEERVTRGENAPPAPLRVDAIATADDLVRVAYSWARRLAGERHLTGPTRASGSLPSRQQRADTAQTVVSWLLAHHEQALTARWAAAYVTDITSEVASARNRYPIEERPVWLPVPCPTCGSQSLARWAPRWHGAPTTIACELDTCRTVIDEDRYGWLIRLAHDLAKHPR